MRTFICRQLLSTKLSLVGKVALEKKKGKSKQKFYVRLDSKRKLFHSVGISGLGICLKILLSHLKFINNVAKSVTIMKRKNCNNAVLRQSKFKYTSLNHKVPYISQVAERLKTWDLWR